MYASQLADASERGDLVTVQFIFHRYKIYVNKKIGPQNATALWYAARMCRLDVVHWLLSMGADVNIPAENFSRWTPLHGACNSNNRILAELLLWRGGNIHIAAHVLNNKIALDYISHRETKIFLKYTAKNIDKDAESNPIFRSCLHGEVESITTALRHGFDVNHIFENSRLSLLQAACKGMHVDVIDCLFQHGADSSVTDKDGNSLIHICLVDGMNIVVPILLKKGVDVNIPNKDGNTPLLLSIQRKMPIMAMMLLDHDADVSRTNKVGKSPLRVSVDKGLWEVGLRLLERGAPWIPECKAIFDWIFSTHSFDMIVRGLLVDLPYDRVTPYHCRPSKQNGGSWLRFLDMGSRHQGVTTALRCAVARRVLEMCEPELARLLATISDEDDVDILSLTDKSTRAVLVSYRLAHSAMLAEQETVPILKTAHHHLHAPTSLAGEVTGLNPVPPQGSSSCSVGSDSSCSPSKLHRTLLVAKCGDNAAETAVAAAAAAAAAGICAASEREQAAVSAAGVAISSRVHRAILASRAADMVALEMRVSEEREKRAQLEREVAVMRTLLELGMFDMDMSC